MNNTESAIKINENRELLKKEMRQLADEILAKHFDFLFGLKIRWEDEKHYEDWRDYEEAIKSKITEYKIIKIIKVGIVVRTAKFDMQLKVNMDEVKYKIIRLHHYPVGKKVTS